MYSPRLTKPWHSRSGKPSEFGAWQREAGTKPNLKLARGQLLFLFSSHIHNKKKDRIINHLIHNLMNWMVILASQNESQRRLLGFLAEFPS
jgi:hypothetical protein